MKRRLVDEGRELLASERRSARWDATLEGCRPRKGLWLVHRKRRRVYGQILFVRTNGRVVVRAWVSAHTPVDSEIYSLTLIDGGYSYAAKPPAGFVGVSRFGIAATPEGCHG